MNRRSVLGSAAALAWALSSTAGAAPAAPARHVPRTAIGRIRQRGTLRMAVIPQQPWYFQDTTGRWSGLDVDVGQRLADDLGVKPTYLASTWNGIADDVALGDADLALSLWPTPRRALSLAFSTPYATTQVTLIAHRTKAAGRATVADFNRAEVQVGVPKGGLAGWVAAQRLPLATRRDFDTDAEAWAALLAGDLHAVVAQTPVPEAVAAEGNAALSMPLSEPLSWRSESFALRPADTDLLLFVNAWLRHGEDIGWLPERRLAWFGNLPVRRTP